MSISCLMAAAVRHACFTWGVLVVMPTRCGLNSWRKSTSGCSSTSASYDAHLVAAALGHRAQVGQRQVRRCAGVDGQSELGIDKYDSQRNLRVDLQTESSIFNPESAIANQDLILMK